MQSVLGLSEIHPRGIFPPLKQAVNWHGLPYKLYLDYRDKSISEQLRAIEYLGKWKDCKSMVVRSWDHWDFHGVPFNSNPSKELWIRGEETVALVRHPATHYRSFVRNIARLDPDSFFAGVQAYLEQVVENEIRVIRYEDFCADPERVLRIACDALGLGYDRCWRYNYLNYKMVTGDRGPIRRIEPQSDTPALEKELLEKIDECGKYHDILKRLGYLPAGEKK
jgi:hypothetical protein